MADERGVKRRRALFGPNAARPLAFPWRSVLHCLRERRITFIGDSVSRYQDLNLVHFFAHGEWHSESPAFEIEWEWGEWAAFSEGTSRRLATYSSFELCDS